RTRKPILPRFSVGESAEPVDEAAELRRQATAGLAMRLDAHGLAPGASRSDYEARLDFELSIIERMKFPGYFLIVSDFIKHAKAMDIPVGPGRGSGAGSVVAWALTITDLDPLRFGLLFERFLNPERVSMPDFDIDFCQDRRDEVIQYVVREYGADRVAQIITFGKLQARAVVRDCGRVLGMPYGQVDRICKLIPQNPANPISLQQAIDGEAALRQMMQDDPAIARLMDIALKLEGLYRHASTHAAGVVIGDRPLVEIVPLYKDPRSEMLITQYSMKYVEQASLVKFDFLGLTTLTVLDWTLRYVRQLDPDSHIRLEALALDDPAAYRVFATANTTAVFQFESRGMRELLARARPDRFEDIIALVALYRPGPMDLIPDFIERKHGRRFEYLHPLLETVLAPTYGIMVYQEQVMQAAQLCAGYSLGGADLLRRAMGKKKPEEMAKQRAIFVEGAGGRGIGEAKANEIFDYMEKFAGYGFNKSHAAAYALVAYQTAWFKAHHAAAFMAANLSAVMDDTDKVQLFFDDARANGLEVLPPDINAGGYRFAPMDRGRIRYGLGAGKGTGQAAIDSIVAAREAGGPFRDLFDFCGRVDTRLVNRRVVESLVRAGAFDCIDPARARLFASAGVALAAAEQAERSAQQSSLFGALQEGARPLVSLVQAAPWSEGERLQHERAALGFYLSGHPFSEYAREFASVVRAPLSRLLPPGPDEQARSVVIGGVVESVRMQKTQGGRMAVAVLSDGTGSQEVTLYAEVFDQYRDLVKEDAVVLMEARLRMARRGGDEGEQGAVLRVSGEKVYGVAQARARFARALKLSMNGEASARKLRQLLEPYRKASGACPVTIEYRNGDATAVVLLGEAWRVVPEERLLQSLHQWLQPGNVRLVYPA
ncbi:MAG: DNA polymerase III subunit alpha, partial [Betaproteobacteria bacterium]